jgi:glycine/sarcosine N-methyltransferase
MPPEKQDPSDRDVAIDLELHREVVGDYDRFVNWEARLARELPFLRDIFDEVGVRSLIDVGAGTARHAIAYAGWGMAVDAVDPDELMLASAQHNIAEAAERIAKAGGQLRLVKGGFGELQALGLADADALTCTGNALPHVRGRVGLSMALADFRAVLRPGGVLVLQLLNHERLLATKQRALMPVVREVPEGTRVFLRVFDYPADGGEFLGVDFATLVRDATGEWKVASHRAAHTVITTELLRAELAAAGFEAIELLGGHDRRPLSDADESVLVVARRR